MYLPKVRALDDRRFFQCPKGVGKAQAPEPLTPAEGERGDGLDRFGNRETPPPFIGGIEKELFPILAVKHPIDRTKMRVFVGDLDRLKRFGVKGESIGEFLQ